MVNFLKICVFLSFIRSQSERRDFVGFDIRKIIIDSNFEARMTTKENEAWVLFLKNMTSDESYRPSLLFSWKLAL